MRTALFIMFFFTFNTITSQNLIRNSSFEEYNDTLLNYTRDASEGFDSFVKHENSPSTQLIGSVIPPWFCYNTADYYNYNSTFIKTYDINNITYTVNTFGVPENLLGYSIPKEGNYYAGFISYKGNQSQWYLDWKEYIYQQLETPLQPGKTYCLNFWVKLASCSNYATKQVGALFSATLPSMASTYYINAQPQIENNNTYIADTLNWTLVQDCFVADGGEQYIIIGNFNTNANTDKTFLGNNPHCSQCCNPFSYYYIDDISLSINNNTTNMFESTENLSMIDLYPNPTSDKVIINKNTHKNVFVIITNIVGKEILKTNTQKEIDISTLEKGIYFVDIYIDKEKITTKKIIKE